MKNVFIFIVFLSAAAFSMSNISIPVTFGDSTIIEASDFNSNFEAFRNYINALIDTLEKRFVRFNDVKDSTFQKINVDSIRGNPDVDSMSGNPRFDSLDAGYGSFTKVDINGGTADGVVIGQAGPEDADFDSIDCRTIKTDNYAADTLTAAKSIIAPAADIDTLKGTVRTTTIINSSGIQSLSGSFSGLVESGVLTIGGGTQLFKSVIVSDSLFFITENDTFYVLKR